MPLKVLITNTKVGRNTKASAAGISEGTFRHPDAMTSVFNAVDSISKELSTVIQSPASDGISLTEKEEKLGELMEMNQGLLQCTGVSHASIETILRTTLKYKLASKSTGAGGGGCVLTLLPSCILFLILHLRILRFLHLANTFSMLFSLISIFRCFLPFNCFLDHPESVLSATVVAKAIKELESSGFQCLTTAIGGDGVQVALMGLHDFPRKPSPFSKT
ncbi:hypothetical protein SLE2022_082440 [Rubroshorea leprosula]